MDGKHKHPLSSFLNLGLICVDHLLRSCPHELGTNQSYIENTVLDYKNILTVDRLPFYIIDGQPPATG